MTKKSERISFLIPSELTEKLEKIVSNSKYSSRSEAIRDALRMFVAEYYWKHEPGRQLQGSIMLVYDHHDGQGDQDLLNVQHDTSDLIIATQHIHFDHDTCLEILAVDGTGEEIYDLVNRLRAVKSTKQVRLITV